MIKKWYARWVAHRAFNTLFIIAGDCKFQSEEFRAMVAVLDILRKRM